MLVHVGCVSRGTVLVLEIAAVCRGQGFAWEPPREEECHGVMGRGGHFSGVKSSAL